MSASLRPAAAALIGLSGTLGMLSMVPPLWGDGWPFILAAATGASCMGYVFADCFGHSGRRGLALCLAGALMTTVFGAAVAGLCLGLVAALAPVGLIIGPLVVGQALLTSPPTLAIWVGTMTLAHLMMGLLRTRHLIPS